MSLKKDESGRRWVEVECEVPGTPEEVWAAIATGKGVSSWFVPTEKRDDGTVVSHFGPGMDAIAKETAYDPPRRFAAEGEMAPGVKMATEWFVEARAGGTCVVRVVHSLFASTDDWDNQLENIEAGWPDYFRILRLYLENFSGLPCSPFQMVGFAAEPAAAAWDSVAKDLGVVGAVRGEHRSSPPASLPLAGIVESGGERGHPHQIMLKLDQPTMGIAHSFALSMGGMVCVVLRMYWYGDQAAALAARDEPLWQAWMQKHFPPPAGGPPTC